MSYSLLDRFRGAWLGAVIGQKCGGNKQQNHHNSLSNRQSWFEWSTKEIVSMIQEPRSVAFPEHRDFQCHYRASTLALWLLPIILYHHDDWLGLSNFLRLRKEPQFLEEIDNILVWCYTIRLALRGELFSPGLSQRAILGTQLEQKASLEWIEKVEMFCLQGFDSTQLIAQLWSMKNREIPLALFCFSNNPQNFGLTTQQALSLEGQAANVTALSATLSGAYNGITSIPVNWRVSLQSDRFYEEIMIKTEEMMKEWVGIDSTNSSIVPSVITAPKVLQSRSGLTAISQQEYI